MGELEIINIALTRIGANDITSLSDGTAEQRVAVNLWDNARRCTLRDHPWNFALADVELSQVDGYTPFEFKYAYQLPSDCIRLFQVYGNPTYKVQGRQILTDEEIVKVKYVRDVTDTAEWDASFVDVMAQRLAAEMAYALTKSQSTADSMYTIYANKLRQARFIDSTEDVPDQLGGHTSNYIGVRS